MKFKFTNTILFAFAVFTSCSTETVENENHEGSNTIKGVECSVKPIINANEVSFTRSTLTPSSSGMDFAWEENEKVTIFNNLSNSTYAVYTLDHFTTPSKTHAIFKADGFDLKKDERYYSLSTTESKAKINSEKASIPDKNNIILSYEGQRMVSDGSYAHLGAYDYMAASALCKEDGSVSLQHSHLGLTLRFYISKLTPNAKYKRIEIYDSENSFLQPKRYLNLANPKWFDADGNYSPSWEPYEKDDVEYTDGPRFCLALGANDVQGISIASDGWLESYIELPPFDFTGKTMVFALIPADASDNTSAKKVFATYTGLNLEAGKAYQLVMEAKEFTKYDVTIKLNHDWQHGNKTDNSAKTRATGDPGYDNKLPTPQHLYYIFCVGGKVREMSDINNSTTKYAVNHIEVDGTNNKWLQSQDNVISTFNKQIEFTVEESEKAASVTKNVYIVASDIVLNDATNGINIFSSIANNTDESTVKSIVYSVKGANASCTALDNTQTFLRDLYSTPLPTSSSEVFVGKLTEPYQDITLYHTAAKVDLKWNNETSTALSGNVSVKNVKDTGLYLFKPTENAYESGSYTVSAPITTGTMWNGRQVFYLPQFANPNCSYDVTIGANTHTGANKVTFTPSTANGFTSWLRWLKTYSASAPEPEPEP